MKLSVLQFFIVTFALALAVVFVGGELGQKVILAFLIACVITNSAFQATRGLGDRENEL